MKQIIAILAVAGMFAGSAAAQKYITKEGVCDIFSETSFFTIEATNKKVASILDASNGDIVASTLMRSFKYQEALVEEHFNENYMESHMYPKGVFKGKITNFSEVDLGKDGIYPITIEGELSLHGETNSLTTPGKLVVKGEIVTGTTEFEVSLAAYKIKVEEKYKDRIRDEIKIDLHFDYNLMK
ncbi:MAG: YceI family protein [Bacteroidetes bacterium]|nr:YceI family protein [Bacteroidota bacterium]